MSSTSDDEAGGGGRRASGRVRKAPERLDAGPLNPKKKQRVASGSEGEGEGDLDSQDEGMPSETESEEEDEEEDAFKSPSKKKSTIQPRAKRQSQSAAAPKRKPAGAPRQPRRKKNAEGGDDEDAGATGGAIGKGDFQVKDDNPVFNAILNPNSALETTVNDWIEQFGEEPGPAMAELVNFLLRSCGCNSSVDEHQAVDEDGVVETLSDIQDEFKNETSLAYPVISRSSAYKKFRSSLGSFISRLYQSTASSEILYETNFCDVFLPWIVTLSSSKIRSFRHTATLFGLHSVAGLSAVHVAVKKEHATAHRAKEAEAKKGRKDKARLKDLEKTAMAIHKRQTQVEDFIESLWKTIFMNRYRDTDAGIRSECVSALGGWTKVNPDYWVDGRYVRYIGWVLSDDAKEARRESVRALFSLYAKDSYIGTLQHFTERFKGPLVQMALGDVDTTIRVQTIQVLRQMENHGLLEEEQRDEIAKLVFETEPRVRRAAADFFTGLWQEEVEGREKELSAGRGASKPAKNGSGVSLDPIKQVQLKCLAELLIKYGNALDGRAEADEGDENEDEAANEGESLVESKTHRGRVTFAVEALWDQLDTVQDWQSIMDFLLLDHSSASATNSKGGRKKARSKATQAGDAAAGGEVEDSCKMTEEEETLLVEVLVASLTRVVETAISTTKKGKEQDDDAKADVTRAVIDALPRLFAKHQTVSARIVDILAIPRLLVLDLYLDLRMVTAYEGLWDAVMTQFFKYSDADVLDQAIQTILFLRKTSTLGNTNADKMTELEEKLVTSLREAVAGKDLETDAFEEDELHSTTASFARFDRLYKVVDLSDALQSDDNGKRTSVLEIVESIVERGRLGYKDEASLVQYALSIQGSYLMWETLAVTKKAGESDQTDYGAIASLVERRGTMLEKFEEFSVGQTSNAAEAVKQTALLLLLDAHNLSRAITSAKSDPDGKLADLRFTCTDEFQSRCAGFVEAEIERRRDEIEQAREEEAPEDGNVDKENDSDEEDEDAPAKKSKKKTGNTAKAKEPEPAIKALPTAAELRAKRLKEQARLVAARKFERAIVPFVRAMHSGVVDLRHAAVILPHYERFGAVFDSWCKLLVQDLRDEGIYAKSGELVSTVVVDSLRTACELLLDSDSTSASDDQLIAVGRLLSSATAIRGPQLAIVRRLPAEDMIELHTTALKYIIRKVAQLDSAGRMSTRNRALGYFKALAHLLLGVDGRTALTLNSTLESVLESNEVEISTTSKTWEPLRAYKKRLVTAMSKDPRIQQAAAKKADDQEELAAQRGQEQGQAKKRRDAERGEGDLESEEEEAEDGEEPAVPSPKRRKVAEENEPAEEDVDDDEEEVRSLLVGSSPAGSKRSLEGDEEDDDNVSITSLTDIKRKSKRARR